MNEILKLSDDLTLKIESKYYEAESETEYIFSVEEKSTGINGTQTIIVKEFEHIDFKNQEILDASLSDVYNSLEDFWKKYKDISDLQKLGDVIYLLPFVLSRFGIKN